MAIVFGRQRVATAGGASLRERALRVLPYAVILALALVLRHIVGGVSDVSWQITLSEKILAGQRLYIDLLEVNPPASTFLYLPAVALARVLHVSPERLIDLQTLVAACLSLFVTGRILVRAPQFGTIDTRAASIFLLAVLTLLPLRTFAQREHVALIAMLPVLAAAAARAAGVVPLRWQSVVVGLCGGAIICIKPHFALAIVFIYAIAAIRSRSIRPLFALENWIAAAIVLFYVAIVVLLYPAFLTTMMPLLADLYLPARRSLTDFPLFAPVLLWAAAFAVVVALDRRAVRTLPFQMIFAASLGFAIAYLIQGKGWPYQALPMLALAVIGIEIVLRGGRPAADRVKAIFSVAALIAVTSCAAVWLHVGVETRSLAAEVKRIAHRPSVVVISGDIAHGHPLVRAVEGRWISAVCSLWIMNNAARLDKAGLIPPAAGMRIAAYVAADRARLIADIRDGKPGVILIHEADPAWTDWASADPEVKAELANYSRLNTVDGITIYKRRG